MCGGTCGVESVVLVDLFLGGERRGDVEERERRVWIWRKGEDGSETKGWV